MKNVKESSCRKDLTFRSWDFSVASPGPCWWHACVGLAQRCGGLLGDIFKARNGICLCKFLGFETFSVFFCFS